MLARAGAFKECNVFSMIMCGLFVMCGENIEKGLNSQQQVKDGSVHTHTVARRGDAHM